MDEAQKTIDETERLRAIIDELTESRERWYSMAKQFAVELTKAKRECDAMKAVLFEDEHMSLDDALEHCEEFKAESERMRKERDEARKAARFYRDLYVSQVGRTYPEEYRLSWEAEE